LDLLLFSLESLDVGFVRVKAAGLVLAELFQFVVVAFLFGLFDGLANLGILLYESLLIPTVLLLHLLLNLPDLLIALFLYLQALSLFLLL
jgi:hypothetical protein